jgi:hypothetical protein
MLFAAIPREICCCEKAVARVLVFASWLSIELPSEWSKASESEFEGNSSEELLEASNKLTGPLLYKLAVLELEGRGGASADFAGLNDQPQDNI